MEKKELNLIKDDIKDLYKCYIEIIALIEILKKNVKELPVKEVI